MATILRREGVGKRVLSSAKTATLLASIPRYPCTGLPLASERRTPSHFHSSMYEKNPNDPVTEMVVPDNISEEDQPEVYWIPHPETGVFVPPMDQDVDVGRGSSREESVLEQQAFFRPSSIDYPEKPMSLKSLEVEVHSGVAEPDASPLRLKTASEVK